MIYCFECEEHGEFDVNLEKPAQQYKCPKCKKYAKRKFIVNTERHRTVDEWLNDQDKRKDKSQI